MDEEADSRADRAEDSGVADGEAEEANGQGAPPLAPTEPMALVERARAVSGAGAPQGEPRSAEVVARQNDRAGAASPTPTADNPPLPADAAQAAEDVAIRDGVPARTEPMDAQPSAEPTPSRAASGSQSRPAAGSASASLREPVAASSDAVGCPEPWRPEGVHGAGTLDAPWGIAARFAALSGLMALALALLLQFSINNDWLDAFLTANALEMAPRMRLIFSMAGALGAGLVVAGLLLSLARKMRTTWQALEGWAWWGSPVLLVPLLPMLLRVEPWRNKHEELLTTLVVVLLVTEPILRKSLNAVPPVVSRGMQVLGRITPGWWKRRGPWTVVLLAALGYIAFFTFFTLRWHWKLRTHTYDVSINNNLLYGGLHGIFMHSPIAFPDDPAKYMGAHVKWGGYLFLPIYAIFPRVETLLVIQSSMLGLGAIPLFAFARKRISDWAAVAVVIAYLCYYPMHAANFYEVKYVPIATFFVLSTAWAADARRWVLFGLAFFAAALMREDVPVGLAVMGAFLLLSGHRPWAGLIMAVVASTWFFILRFVIMNSVSDWWFPNIYKDLWAPGEEGFGSVIKTLVTNPLFVLSHVLVKTKFVYLLHLFVPIAFIPARRWYLWAAFIPGFILTLLATDYKPINQHTFQYVMHWTPYLFLAVPLALAAIGQSKDHGRVRAWAAIGTMLVASVLLTFHYGAFPQRDKAFKGGFFTIDWDFSDKERQRYHDVLELKKLVPDSASVSTTENVGPHFSSRVNFYSMRTGTQDADYIVAERSKLDVSQTRTAFRVAVRSGEYGVVKRLGDIVLLKRGYDTSGNFQLLRDWKP